MEKKIKICWIYSGKYPDFSGTQALLVRDSGKADILGTKRNPKSLALKALRRICIKNKIFESFWFPDCKADLSVYDLIFIKYGPLLADFLKLKYKTLKKKTKVVVWNENSVFGSDFDTFGLDKIPNVVFCSYSPTDSKKFGFFYRPSFVFWNLRDYCESVESDETDVLFIGSRNDRKAEVFKIFDNMERAGLKCRALFVNPIKPLDYSKYLGLIKKCRIFLDIPRPGTSAPTLRCLEANLLGVKAITLSEEIMKRPYYREANILVLKAGSNIGEQTTEFLKREFVNIQKEEYGEYLFDKWVSFFVDSFA